MGVGCYSEEQETKSASGQFPFWTFASCFFQEFKEGCVIEEAQRHKQAESEPEFQAWISALGLWETGILKGPVGGHLSAASSSNTGFDECLSKEC